MHRINLAITCIAVTLALAAGPAFAQDEHESHAAADGGIHVDGWMGKIDAKEAADGQMLGNASFRAMGDGFHVTTGPAVAYWHSDHTASGNYTVKATFTEPEFMNLSGHAHPYGIVIGGNDMGTDAQTYLYCSTYGNGNFIVRGFGPEPFQVNGRRGEAHDAVNKAAENGAPVTQEIALSVNGDKVECTINGTVVGSYDKSDVVGESKLKSTDGVYGIRFGHNTEVHVEGLTMTQN